MRKVIKTRLLAAAAMSLGLAVPTQADKPGEAEAIDGALLVPPPRAAALKRDRAQLAAPELPAIHAELPPTMIPAHRVEEIRRRASDLNRDGIVDDADRAVLKQKLGPCPGGGPCAGDLNGDGGVDDADEKLLNQHLRQTSSTSQPHFEEVGYVQPAPPNLLPPLPPQARADGSRAVRVELRSANAVGLRVQLKGFQPQSGLEVRVYEPAGAAVRGPYTAPRVDKDGAWWAPTIFGDTIGVELTLPAGAAHRGPMPTISSLVYMYCTDPVKCHSGPGTALNCHNDVTCFPDWANNEAQGIAMIYFISGASCGRCTGALLNRGPGDFSPLFMTANHCVSTQTEADTLEVFWLYTTDTCNGTPANYNDLAQTDGGVVLKRHTGTDWTLLGLVEQPMANFYVGWDPSAWAFGGGATGIHHPRGTFKRVSFGTSAGSQDAGLFCVAGGPVSCPSCTATGGMCVAVDTWTVSYPANNLTEPASSGSPIFDGAKRVRGTLTGGASTCSGGMDQYGRLDRAFTNLRYFLDNTQVPATTVFVNGAVGGDAGNNGDNERGTALNPFNSVYEATFCVRSGQDVSVTPGTYNESMTVWRPMRITRNGASGTVRIGG